MAFHGELLVITRGKIIATPSCLLVEPQVQRGTQPGAARSSVGSSAGQGPVLATGAPDVAEFRTFQPRKRRKVGDLVRISGEHIFLDIWKYN